MSREASRFVALTAALLILAATTRPAGAGQVLTTPIPPPGAVSSIGEFIDESGRVAGDYWSGTSWRAFLYDGSTYTDLLPPGAVDSYLYDVNDSLGAVGWYCDGITCNDFVYVNGSFVDIGMPAGASSSDARAIGNNGHIAGTAWYPATNSRAWHYVGGVFTEILPAGSQWSGAFGVNGSGQVVGQHNTGTESRSFLYDGGTISDPAPPGLTETAARRINDAGTIIGWGLDSMGPRCWINQGGVPMVLDPPGSSWGECIGLSADDTVVGVAWTGIGAQSFVYRDGNYQYIESRNRDPLTVYDVNSSFQVTGSNGVAFLVSQRAAEARPEHGPYRAPGSADAAGDDKARLPMGDSAEAIIGTLLPAPEIKTSYDAQMWGNYMPKFSLTPWAFAGQPAEWWVVAQTPSQTYSYDVALGAWVPGFFPSLTMPVRKVPEIILPPAGSRLGIYTYYFGLDFLVNGIVDPQFLVYEGKTVLHR